MKNKTKITIIGWLTAMSLAAPMAVVVSCGKTETTLEETETTKVSKPIEPKKEMAPRFKRVVNGGGMVNQPKKIYKKKSIDYTKFRMKLLEIQGLRPQGVIALSQRNSSSSNKVYINKIYNFDYKGKKDKFSLTAGNLETENYIFNAIGNRKELIIVSSKDELANDANKNIFLTNGKYKNYIIFK